MIAAILLVSAPNGLNAQTDTTGNHLKQIQEKLKSDEILLEYYLSDSTLILTAVTNDVIYSSCQSVDLWFLTIVKRFSRSLKTAGYYNFYVSGQTLYAFLVAPIEDLLLGKKRMIIIPGEELNGLPFEAFIRCHNYSEPFTPKNSHYLVQDFEIIYHWSLRKWEEPFNCNPEPELLFIGFSPVIKTKSAISTIPFSLKETTEIGRLFKKKGYPDQQIFIQFSGEESFVKNVTRGKIIHLATHCISGKYDDHPGGFIFTGFQPEEKAAHPSPGLLTSEEIRDLHLNADLLVLNSCSSYRGFMSAGMNSVYFSRNFMIAGVHNILSTLWNVTDEYAHHFMIDFYRRWLSGKTYSEALREVKLQMISNPKTALPLVWAPYILMGQ
ncbi:MAG: CHAT domain-containing protein [Bacteroidales bacterium]|nr:CHAT domain-containing protein [Bacteroidales bacterium]MDD4604091.1 CHAT domain-containing protein [Bacteroidales bacterium]